MGYSPQGCKEWDMTENTRISQNPTVSFRWMRDSGEWTGLGLGEPPEWGGQRERVLGVGCSVRI